MGFVISATRENLEVCLVARNNVSENSIQKLDILATGYYTLDTKMRAICSLLVQMVNKFICNFGRI